MEQTKGDKYAKTALRISYLNILLVILGLINGGIVVISLIACLGSFSYANLAMKNNTNELKKVKYAKTISTIIAVISLVIIVLSFII